MPRAFLITNRRYKNQVGYNTKDCSSVAEENKGHWKRGHVNCNGTGVDGPAVSVLRALYDDLHHLSNLEQLAEISLATAAHHNRHQWHRHHHHHHRLHPSTKMGADAAATGVEAATESMLRGSGANGQISSPATRRCYTDDDDDDDEDRDVEKFCGYFETTTSDIIREGSDTEEEEEPDDDDDDAVIDTDDDDVPTCIWSASAGDIVPPLDAAPHACPECGKQYSTSSNLARHRQTHRSISDKKARKCPHCEKVYVSMPAYSMHVRTHGQGCRCPFCGKCFSRPWLLQGHIRTHTGEKPFKCPVCSKAFADKSNLRAHIQTHSNVKPYVCQRCGKAFALKSYLYKHEESSCMRSHDRNSFPEK